MKKFLSILLILLSVCSSAQDTTAQFEATKGKWSFPVSSILQIDTIGKGCFGMPFNSFWLTIKTQQDATVRAIQGGYVQAVSQLADGYIVITKSGRYFLVYSVLSKPQVTKGSFIAEGTEIGKVNESEITINLLKDDGKELNINRWFDWNNICR